MKKKYNISLSVAMLFLLSGCDYTYNTTYLIGDIYNSVVNAILGIVEGMNSINASLVRMLMETVSSGNNTGLEILKSFGSLNSLVALISTLSLATIIVQFARSIYRNFFMTSDNIYAPSAIELIKKVFVAVFTTYLIPYIVITAFVVTSYAGMKLPTIMITNDELDTSLYDAYTLMKESGISFSTYCELGQKDAGVANVSALKGSDGKKQIKYEILMQDNSYSNIKVPIEGMSAYDFYCGYANEKSEHLKDMENTLGDEIHPKNVYENFADSKVLAKIAPIGNSGAFVGVDASLTLVLGVIGMIAIGIAWLVILLSITRRVIDLIVLVGMSWWYIGASISDNPKQSSIGELFKKLLSICLTQFIMTIEIYIFATTLSGILTISGLVSTIVWIGVLTSTPTVVEEMISSTGAVDSVSGLSKGAWSFAKGIFLGK